MLGYKTFKKEIAAMSTVISVNRQSSYKIVSVVDDSLFFIREGKDNTECINLNELYNFYINETDYKTTTAKEYLSSRVYSPSVAILKELKQIELVHSKSLTYKITNWWNNLNRKQKSDRLGCGVSLIGFIILVIYVTLFAPESSTSDYKFEQFDTCVITSDIIGAINEEYADELGKYYANNDKIGILDMMYKGTAYGVNAGDECMFVRNKGIWRCEIHLFNKGVNIIVPKEILRPK